MNCCNFRESLALCHMGLPTATLQNSDHLRGAGIAASRRKYLLVDVFFLSWCAQELRGHLMLNVVLKFLNTTKEQDKTLCRKPWRAYTYTQTACVSTETHKTLWHRSCSVFRTVLVVIPLMVASVWMLGAHGRLLSLNDKTPEAASEH
eukprot:239413-Amphidinium_carterae.1